MSNFKYTNFDFDKISFKQVNTIIYVDAYYLPSITNCPICNSFDLYNDGYKIKTVKHCTNYTWLYIVTCHIKKFKCKNCCKRFYEKDTFSFPNIRLSKETVFAILDRLKLPNETFESVAKDFHLSKQEVIYVFDKYVDYKVPQDLPIVMS